MTRCSGCGAERRGNCGRCLAAFAQTEAGGRTSRRRWRDVRVFVGKHSLSDALPTLALEVATVNRRMHAPELRVARINRARITVIAIDRRVHTAGLRIARIDRADIAIVAIDRLMHAPTHRVAGVDRAGVVVTTVNRLVDAAELRIAGIDCTDVAIVTIDRCVKALSGVVITGVGRAGIGIVTGGYTLTVDALLAGGTAIATGAAVFVVVVQVDAFPATKIPRWIAPVIEVAENPAHDQ